MKKKGKKKAAIAVSVLLVATIGVGTYFLTVDTLSKKHNLITLDTSELPEPVMTPSEDSFVQLSEVNMHYQVYSKDGCGYPLILLHGNGGSVNSLMEAAWYLASEYTVYLIESRCHGQSSDPGEISYELMAKDVKEFIEAMGLEKPYFMGHSDGGIVGLQIASMYPDLLGAMISCGANTNPKTFKLYFPAMVKFNNMRKPDKLNDMMLTLPQFTKDDLAKITTPSYIVAGEFDIMYLSDTVFIHDCIENSKIAIIKGANHGAYISHDGKQAYVLAKDFFDSLAYVEK